jgi:flagellar basal-body rod modification protein FlgD
MLIFTLSLAGAMSAQAQDAKTKAATCAACHGPDGNSVNPDWPNLAGQHSQYLVAQLKYQDPSKPMDSSEMISQSAQLSVVDKLESISSTLAESNSANRLTLGGAVIGKQVTYLEKDGATMSALVTGVAFDGATTVLKAGTTDIPLASVKSISTATPA